MALESRPVRVNVYFDPEVESYWANSPDLDGLSASGKTRGELEQEAQWAAEALLELAGVKAPPELTFMDAVYRPE
jgi:predicted RNase H-like HicB family nuclease